MPATKRHHFQIFKSTHFQITNAYWYGANDVDDGKQDHRYGKYFPENEWLHGLVGFYVFDFNLKQSKNATKI